ncbi:MAG: SBBP repeat-containing protein, partial [Sphingobacteriaceae bacterium]|nr:SBBP repeat-containing protein [Sphingobacteriaceae bacterium]
MFYNGYYSEYTDKCYCNFWFIKSVLGGVEDAFLAKFDSIGVRQWGTYYGGNKLDIAFGSCTDKIGNIYISGRTESSVTAVASPGSHQSAYGGGTIDAFLVKFNTNGVRIWGTYYGGTTTDYGYGCTTDANGNVYLCGQSDSQTSIST